MNDLLFIFFVDLTITVAIVIENGGKIEKKTFWTTIWRFYNYFFLEIRHQYSSIPKIIFIFYIFWYHLSAI